MGCRPVSSRLITIRLRAAPFNIKIVQVYAPTSAFDDNEIEAFYDQLQNVIVQTPKKDILLCKETGMCKWARMIVETGKELVDPSAMIQMRKDSYSWSLPPVTISCSTIIEEKEVGWSRQHPSRTGPSRWRGCNHHSHDNLQQNLADWRIANPIDPVLSHYTSQERPSVTQAMSC